MYEKTITELQYDYLPSSSDGIQVWPEEYTIARLGEKDVVGIREHLSQWAEDKGYYEIEYKEGVVIRTYRPSKVIYK